MASPFAEFKRPAQIRVELKKKYSDPEKNFKEMLHQYKRTMNNLRILQDHKDHSTFESRSRKDRRKRRESAKKMLMESIKTRILAGERVMSPAGLVKKVVAKIRKEELKEREKRERKKKEFGDAYEED